MLLKKGSCKDPFDTHETLKYKIIYLRVYNYILDNYNVFVLHVLLFDIK